MEQASRGPGGLTPSAVLDTNVVLDCLLFDDPSARPLTAALAHGQLQWSATAAMLQEILFVVQRPALDRWAGRRAAVLAAMEHLPVVRQAPLRPAAGGWPLCRDAADQMFIDLAVATGTPWLLTRDKDLLHLARAAARRGVTVCTPAAWAARQAMAAASAGPSPEPASAPLGWR